MSIKLKAEKRGGEVMRSTAERRMAILEYMCERRHETLENLMFEFDVSRSTIIRDLSELSRHYPICTRPGNGGGVHIMEGFFLGRKYLNAKQHELLERLSVRLDGDDLKTMKSILKVFSAPKMEN